MATLNDAVRIFNFLRRDNKSGLSPEEMLANIIEFIPEFYKDKQQYKESVEYLKYNEWGLALESLIDLADESGDYFSNDFWFELANAADKMNLVQQSNHCRQEIEKIKTEVSWIIPKGSTISKIDDTHFQHYYSEKVIDKWTNDRRNKDKVYELIDKTGIHLKSNTRSGYLYILEDRKIAKAKYELCVNGLLIHLENVINWVLPKRQKIMIDERQKIKTYIISWALQTKNAIEFS